MANSFSGNINYYKSHGLPNFKTCKYIKNQKSKILTTPILSFIYIEENKKKGLPGMMIR